MDFKMNLIRSTFFLLFGLLAAGAAVQQPEEPTGEKPVVNTSETLGMQADTATVAYSFVFVGCNRVDRHDQHNPDATNDSSANVAVLKRIMADVLAEERRPDAFFFLGDLVYAEKNQVVLNDQLMAWVKQYQDPDFSKMAKSGIEMVAIPGNHEMLYWADHNVPGHEEWPLEGATEIWMRYMSDFMPKDREKITGTDAQVNQMTFTFKRKNVGFVVMNTDTYNPGSEKNPWGLEGQIPEDWIVAKVQEYQNDPQVDHIFVLGHKPYYVMTNGLPTGETGHMGLPQGPGLWPRLQNARVLAMLSAHVHDYQRMQPGDEGTYQVIAGNGGSSGPACFFGYTTINIMTDGTVQLVAKGFDQGSPYYTIAKGVKTTVRDQTVLSWEKNANPYSPANACH
jgi:hypothetical protein